MRGIAIDEWGGRDVLELRDDLEPPPVAPDGVLVRVRAAGLNPVDWKVREGNLAAAFPWRFPLILGWDAAGVVEQVGPAVTAFQPGDEVYGYIRRHELHFGTYAELSEAPEDFWAPKPVGLGFDQAAAMPLAALTALQALDTVALASSETLFVSSGSGGVGHFAVQLAAARGARVIAGCSRANADFVRELGAEPVDREAGEVSDQVRALCRDGVDAAFDLFGGDRREDAFAVLGRGGRLVSIAGPPPEPRPGVGVHYVFVRPGGEQLRELARLVDEGHLTPNVEAAFPLERIADAHDRLEGGAVRGKLVLVI